MAKRVRDEKREALFQEVKDRMAGTPDHDRVLGALHDQIEKDPEMQERLLRAVFDQLCDELEKEQRKKDEPVSGKPGSPAYEEEG